jgi:hypothetical protein
MFKENYLRDGRWHNLTPGAANLVDGTAIYYVEDLKPKVQKSGAMIEICQDDFKSLPFFQAMKNE